jgi:hypothetical protein
MPVRASQVELTRRRIAEAIRQQGPAGDPRPAPGVDQAATGG